MATHPAKFTPQVLDLIMSELTADSLVLDPFAGTGLIATLPIRSVCVEIEKQWATQLVGDSVNLPFRDDVFDAVATSPTYGNRMADHHNAKDISWRSTYRHFLGAELTTGNSGGMQWGKEYRSLHRSVWTDCKRVLRPNGILVVNCKDHIRKGSRVFVTEWHITTIEYLGYELVRHHQVRAKGMRYGQNSSARIDYESVLVFR